MPWLRRTRIAHELMTSPTCSLTDNSEFLFIVFSWSVIFRSRKLSVVKSEPRIIAFKYATAAFRSDSRLTTSLPYCHAGQRNVLQPCTAMPRRRTMVIYSMHGVSDQSVYGLLQLRLARKPYGFPYEL